MADDDAGGALDEVATDDEVEPSGPEVRVPPEWQKVMSTRTLIDAEPLPCGETVTACCGAIEAKMKADPVDAAEGRRVSMPQYVWQWISMQHGAHKQAEAALASLTRGVESSWEAHKSILLFGELCGLLTAPHAPAANRRLFAYLSDDANGAGGLVAADAIASTLSGEGEAGDVAVEAAYTGLERLQLGADEQAALSSQIAEAAEADHVRLDALLLMALGAVRSALASGAAMEVEDEEAMAEPAPAAEAETPAPTEPAEPAEPEPAAAEQSAELVAEEESAGLIAEPPAGPESPGAHEDSARDADAVRAAHMAQAMDWASLISRLPIARDEREARAALFNTCAPSEAGTLSLESVQRGVMGELRPDDDPVRSVCEDAIARAFAAAAARTRDDEGGANGGEGGEGEGDARLGRWGFQLLLTYVRRYFELLVLLDRIVPGEVAERRVTIDECVSLAPKLEPWGVLIADPAAEFGEIGDGDGVHFDKLSSWCLDKAPRSNRHSAKFRLTGHSRAQVLDALTMDPDAARDEAGAAMLPLEPVMETTERSTFGAELSSVQRGFFDASALDDDAGLRERYEQALEELEKLRREVGEAKTANEAQTKQHQTNMSLVLRRNEELQLKLKELNGVVEGVVQRELHRAGPSGGRNAKASTTTLAGTPKSGVKPRGGPRVAMKGVPAGLFSPAH